MTTSDMFPALAIMLVAAWGFYKEVICEWLMTRKQKPEPKFEGKVIQFKRKS